MVMLKKIIVTIIGIAAVSSLYGMQNVPILPTNDIKTISDHTASLQNEHEQIKRSNALKCANIKLKGKRERALIFYGPAGILLTLVSSSTFFEKDHHVGLHPLKTSYLFLLVTIGSCLMGKAVNNLFSTVKDNGDGTFEVISLFTRIKQKLF